MTVDRIYAVMSHAQTRTEDASNRATIGIIVPAFNEEGSIHDVVQQLRQHAPDAEIIVVDDGSTDATEREARREPGIAVVSHERNRGYGAALKSGMRVCSASIIVWFDGDGQHRAEDIEAVVRPVLSGEVDASFGARQGSLAYVMNRVPGKWLLRMVAQLIARRHIPDLNCGLRAFRRRVIGRYLHLLPDGFSASATSTLLMIKRGYPVRFTAIQAHPRVGTSTVRVLRDGLYTFKMILRTMMMFDSLLFFSVLALIQLIAATVYSISVMNRQGLGVPVLGAVVFVSGCLTFFMGVLSAQINAIRQELFELRSEND